MVRRDLIETIGLPRLSDVLDYHSSVEDAAPPRPEAGCAHWCSPTWCPPPAPGTETQWLELASNHFDGEVVLATDLATLDLPR